MKLAAIESRRQFRKMTVSNSSSDDQTVPESNNGPTTTDNSGILISNQPSETLAITSAIPGGIPDFDNLLDGLTTSMLTTQAHSTESDSFTIALNSEPASTLISQRLASDSTPIPEDPTKSSTILPSIHHCLDDMEAIYASDRSFYDDYANSIKKEPADYSIDTSTTTDLTPLKPALGLASAGFSSQQFATSSQYSSPFLTNNDLCYANSYYHASPSVLNGCAVSAAVPPPYADGTPFNSAPMAMNAYVEMDNTASENDLEKIQEKIDYASVTLGIPKDPQTWSCDQTHCWAEWTLNQYNIPLGHVTDFYMSGHTLCSLTQEEFTRRFSYYGDYLYPELDLWKNSFLMGTASTGSSSNVSSSEDEDSTFEHFNHSTNFAPTPNPDTLRPFSSSVIGIPTPVITPLSQPISTVSTGSVLTDSRTTSSLCWRDPMLMQGPTQSRLTPLGVSRTGSSMCMSPVSSLESNSSISWREETQEDVNSLLSATCDPPVGRGKHAIHLWQFLKELLLQPHQFHNCIRWLDRNKGIFKIEDSSRVATLWGRRKNRPAMNYDKLSRSIRQYYKKGIIKKTEHSKRLVYQFQPQYR